MTNRVENIPGSTFQVRNPATGETLETFESTTDQQIDVMLEESYKTFLVWRDLSVEERAQRVQRAGEIFRERSEQLAQMITLEMGKGFSEAKAELSLCEGIFEYYGKEGPRLARDTPIETSAGAKAIVQKLPLGPLLGIMPWNFPAYQLLRFAIPNLVIGNTIIIKPAATCPRSAMMIDDILKQAGIPDGAYETVFADHAQVADIIADDRLQGVSLTGSERAGAIVGEIASRHLKKVVLELGGSDPYIVLDSNDIRESAKTAWTARISNMGQSCNSNKRMIVLDEIFDDFVAELTDLAKNLQPGDPMVEAESTFNPMASVTGAKEIAEQVAEAVDKGAIVHAGGNRVEETYMTPTVLTGVTPDMRAYHEELFGPVAVVYRVNDENEAIRLANDSAYGLAGAVFSTDEERAVRVAGQLSTGMAYVNTAAAYGAQLPFGGIKRSGFGKELGPEGMDEFTNKRLFYINH